MYWELLQYLITCGALYTSVTCKLQCPCILRPAIPCSIPQYSFFGHQYHPVSPVPAAPHSYPQYPLFLHSVLQYRPCSLKTPVHLSTTQYPKVPALFYILYIFVQNKNSVWFASFFVESFLLSKRFYFAMFEDIYSNELKKFRKNMPV